MTSHLNDVLAWLEADANPSPQDALHLSHGELNRREGLGHAVAAIREVLNQGGGESLTPTGPLILAVAFNEYGSWTVQTPIPGVPDRLRGDRPQVYDQLRRALHAAGCVITHAHQRSEGHLIVHGMVTP